MGSSENPAVVKVEGDCTLAGNSGGTGILYVDGGSLTMKGNSEWKGMILIAGEGDLKPARGLPVSKEALPSTRESLLREDLLT